MRSLLVVLALCTSVAADDRMAAEQAQKAAEREKDPAKAAALWETAARGFDRAAAGKRPEIAYAAVQAWERAARLTRPAASSPPRAHGLLAAIAVYLPLAPAAERPGLQLVRASTYLRLQQADQALPLLETIVLAHPTSDAAEHAANLLLDSLNLKGEHAKLRAWTVKLRGMPALVGKRPELAATLGHLHVRFLQRDALAAQQAGDAAKCAALFREAARIAPRGLRIDELLFDAGVCYEAAGERALAIEMWRRVERLKTSLSPRARARADALARK